MAHPYKDHKQSHNGHDRARAKHLLKGYKRGGAVKGDGDKEALSAAKKIVKHEEKELKVEGKKHGGRLDKYARGGRAKSKKPHTQVNIAVVSGHGKDDHASAAPAGGPPSPGGASAPPPPPAMPPMGGGMMPPGMMMGHPPIPPPGAMPPPGGKPPGMMKRGGRTKVIKKAFGGPLGMPQGMPNFAQSASGQNPSMSLPMGQQAFANWAGRQTTPLYTPAPDLPQQLAAMQHDDPRQHAMARAPGNPMATTQNPMAQQALMRFNSGQSPFTPPPAAPQAPPMATPAGTQTGAFKRGGRTKGKMTAGMESGVGRLEASKNARKRG